MLDVAVKVMTLRVMHPNNDPAIDEVRHSLLTAAFLGHAL
jgi:hypothetical protein